VSYDLFLKHWHHGFFVDAKEEKARKYYEQFGFIPMPDNKQQLFLAMNGLQQAYQTIS